MTFEFERYRAALTTEILGQRLDHHSSVGSTMDLARELAATPASHGAVVLADEQSAGRGRRGRAFYSPPGDNLYFTVVLHLAPGQARTLPIAVPLAVVEAIRNYCPSAAIKWPNDIWIGERKCSGMLIDAQSNGGDVVALVGIGINVNGDPRLNPELAGIATSVALEHGSAIPREELLASALNNLEAHLDLDDDALLEQYRRASNTVGRRVRIDAVTGESFEGLAEDIDDRGALLVRRADGALATVEAADVSIRHA